MKVAVCCTQGIVSWTYPNALLGGGSHYLIFWYSVPQALVRVKYPSKASRPIFRLLRSPRFSHAFLSGCIEHRHHWILWLSGSVTYWILFLLYPVSNLVMHPSLILRHIGCLTVLSVSWVVTKSNNACIPVDTLLALLPHLKKTAEKHLVSFSWSEWGVDSIQTEVAAWKFQYRHYCFLWLP